MNIPALALGSAEGSWTFLKRNPDKMLMLIKGVKHTDAQIFIMPLALHTHTHSTSASQPRRALLLLLNLLSVGFVQTGGTDLKLGHYTSSGTCRPDEVESLGLETAAVLFFFLFPAHTRIQKSRLLNCDWFRARIHSHTHTHYGGKGHAS